MKKYLSLFFICLIVTACQTHWSAKSIPSSQEKASQLILGKSQPEIVSLFGNPIINRTEAPYDLWVYRENTCSTLIYFDNKKIARYVDKKGFCPSDENKIQPTSNFMNVKD